jgi:capsular polysaccharide biosynthesis protein
VKSIRRGWRERRDDLALPEVLHVLWEWRLLVLLLVVVPALVVVVVSFSREPVYTAQATVDVRPREELTPGADPKDFLQDVLGDVVSQGGFWSEVQRRAGFDGSTTAFRSRFEFEPFVARDGSPGLQVNFEGPDAVAAAASANAYAAVFVEEVERLNDQRIAGGVLAADAVVIQQASIPGAWSRFQPLLYAVAAAAAGLVLGGAGALIFEWRARFWRGARDAEFTLRAPVLGVIPEFPDETFERTFGEGAES